MFQLWISQSGPFVGRPHHELTYLQLKGGVSSSHFMAFETPPSYLTSNYIDL